MNKTELIESISTESGLTKKDAKEALDALMNAISTTLQSGESISLVGFGSFSVINKAERKGKNPQTGKEIIIPAKKAVKFKPGKELSEEVQ
jgi:DNA-binding protein HU-beta